MGICDDDPEVREFLSNILRSTSDLSVNAVCPNGEAALATQQPVDVWLMDLRMPGIGGRQACQHLLRETPSTKVLFLTSFQVEDVEEGLRAGASGHLFKDESPANIVAAVRAVAAGLTVGSRPALNRLVKRVPGSNAVAASFALDRVDEELIRLVLAGRSNREMARSLHMSESGVKKRLMKLMQRTGATSRPVLMVKLNGG